MIHQQQISHVSYRQSNRMPDQKVGKGVLIIINHPKLAPLRLPDIRSDQYTCNYGSNLNLQQIWEKQKQSNTEGNLIAVKNGSIPFNVSSRVLQLKLTTNLQVYQNLYFVSRLTLLLKQMQDSFQSSKNNIVFASDRSQTALTIKRAQIIQNKEPMSESLSDDFHECQKVLNLKRMPQGQEETIKFQSLVRKKTNPVASYRFGQKSSRQADYSTFTQVLQEPEDNFFNLQKQPNLSQINAYNKEFYTYGKIIFPDSQLKQLRQSKNELLKRTIQIMSNKNQKTAVPIHEGLYKSNTSHKNEYQEQNWDQISNLCDFQIKNQYSQSIQFTREYKSGYAPIEMQKRNNEDIVDDKGQNGGSPGKGANKDKTRNHFIRKQQSTLTLPRTCGVSYIKPSESCQTQLPPFEPLPPLIFQGSTMCLIGSNGQMTTTLDKTQHQLICHFIKSLQTSWLAFVISNEGQMRDLLLGKITPSSKVGFVNGIQNIWPLYTQGTFILILITPQNIETQRQVWETFEKNQTFFKIGILSKKSTSGRKAFLNSIRNDISDSTSLLSQQTKNNDLRNQQFGSELTQNKISKDYENYINLVARDSPQQQKKVSNTFQLLQQELKDNRTVVTMSLRMQIYVEQNDWKQKFTRQNKEMLNCIITALKDRLQKKSIRVIQQRLEFERDGKNSYFDKKFNFLRRTLPTQGQHSQSIVEQEHPTQEDRIGKKLQQCSYCPKQQKRNKSLAISNFLQGQYSNKKTDNECKTNIISNTQPCSASDFIQNLSTQESWKKCLKLPIYYISTRDSFAFDLIQKRTRLKRQNGRQYTRVDYYFYPDNVPTNFGSEYRKLFPQFDVGVTAYHGFYTEQQLKQFQKNIYQMEKKAFKNQFLQMTVQPSIVSTKIKRTKFFFGYRYMWTRCQLSQPCSYVGAGVRKDVTSPPFWTKQISDSMVKQNIVEKDFINSIAINVYHDGKEGLAQHFDDAVRFKQPIYTLRLFSDARLSFGSQFYGFCNGAFIIPLPRGCILVMEQNSYAANGVKHCVRPCDMTGKSAAVILRQMHSQVVSQASKYDQYVDFPAWLSCLSEDQKAITYAQQKRLQSQHIMKVKME